MERTSIEAGNYPKAKLSLDFRIKDLKFSYTEKGIKSFLYRSGEIASITIHLSMA